MKPSERIHEIAQGHAYPTGESGLLHYEVTTTDILVYLDEQAKLSESAADRQWPIDPEDERVVDELMAKRTAGQRVTRLVPEREPEPVSAEGDGSIHNNAAYWRGQMGLAVEEIKALEERVSKAESALADAKARLAAWEPVMLAACEWNNVREGSDEEAEKAHRLSLMLVTMPSEHRPKP